MRRISWLLPLLSCLAWAAPADAAARYTITEIPTLPGYQDSQVTGINNSGQIVGIAYNTSATAQPTDPTGFVISGGTTTTFPIPGVRPYSINNAGRTYASNEYTVFNNVGQQVSGNTLTSGGQTTSLGNFQGSAINDLGTIAGAIPSSGFDTHAAIYKNGQVTDLAPALGLTNLNSAAFGINNRGDVLYNYFLPNGSSPNDAVLYADGHTQAFHGDIKGLNNLGQVVGGDLLMNPDGTTSTLESLLPPAAQSLWGGFNANAINDAGQIVGVASTYDPKTGYYQTHDFLMTPVPTPEPTALVFLLVAAAGCGARTWRHQSCSARGLAWRARQVTARLRSARGVDRLPAGACGARF